MSEKPIRRLRTLSAVLLAAVIMLSLYAAAQAERASSLEKDINAAYERAFYDTAAIMNELEINLEKILITGSEARRQELLGNISRDAMFAQSNLTLLPVSLGAVSESLKFVNQTGDYAAVLDKRLEEGGLLTEDDLSLLSRLKRTCAALNLLLDDIVFQIEQGDRPLSAAEGRPLPVLADMKLAETVIDYPVLLYDGPFSDGRGEPVFKAITGNEITSDEALKLARAFIGNDRVSGIWLTGEGSVPVPCYEISAYTGDGLASIALSKQGGKVIFMLTDGVSKGDSLPIETLIGKATTFLTERDYPPAAVSYWATYDGFLTVNFAPEQDGVLLYPDLIKVEVSMSSGEVTGFEAVNYLTNHTQRTLPTPRLSAREAADLLNERLTHSEGRLCVIPLDRSEALCYEFSAFLEDVRYLIYIDAETGEERNIYRLVTDESGQLVL